MKSTAQGVVLLVLFDQPSKTQEKKHSISNDKEKLKNKSHLRSCSNEITPLINY